MCCVAGGWRFWTFANPHKHFCRRAFGCIVYELIKMRKLFVGGVLAKLTPVNWTMLKLTRLFYWLCVKGSLFLFVCLLFDLIRTFSNKLCFYSKTTWSSLEHNFKTRSNATQLLQIVMVIPSIRLQLFSLLVYWTILN